MIAPSVLWAEGLLTETLGAEPQADLPLPTTPMFFGLQSELSGGLESEKFGPVHLWGKSSLAEGIANPRTHKFLS